jgi:hypothetical protein
MSTEESAAYEAYQQAKRVIHSKPSSVEYNRCPKCGTEWIPPELGCPKCQDATNPTPAPTPRTDGEVFHATPEHRAHVSNIPPVLLVTTADFARTLERELQAKDAEAMHMLLWIGNKMLKPEWDSFKKAIEVADHWKARASTAESRVTELERQLAEAARDAKLETARLEHIINCGAVMTWSGPNSVVSRMPYPVTRAEIDSARDRKEGV